MKRIIFALMTVIILLTSCSGYNELEPAFSDAAFDEAIYDVSASDMAVYGSKLCCISNGKIIDAVSGAEVFTPEFQVTALASCSGVLYVYGEGKIADSEGNVYEIPADSISSFASTHDMLCWSDYDGAHFNLYNIKTGETMSFEPFNGDACTVLPYNESEIIVLSQSFDGSSAIRNFNTSTLKYGEVSDEHENIFTLAYDNVSCRIIAIDGSVSDNTVYSLDLRENLSKSYLQSGELKSDVKKLLYSGGNLIILKKDGRIIVANDEFLDKGNDIITVRADVTDASMFAADRLDEISERLMSKHNIQLVTVKHKSCDERNTELINGSGNIDIYFGHGNELDLMSWEPLEKYECIAELLDSMFDGITQACTYNGHVYGLPSMSSSVMSFMTYNSDLLEKSGLQLPDMNWDINDYYNIAAELRDKGAFIGYEELPVLWLRKYADQFIGFDGLSDSSGRILTSYLTTLKKLYSEQLYAPAGTDKSMILFNGESSTGNPVWYREDVCLYPTVNGERCCKDYFEVAMMNSNISDSMRKEAAATVLAEFASPDGFRISPLIGVYYYKDMSIYTTDPYKTGGKLPDNVPNNDLVNMDEKTAYNWSVYLEYIEHLTAAENNSEWIIYAGSEFEKYLNDEQDLEYTVKLLCDKANRLTDK